MNRYMYTIHTTPSAQLVSPQKSEGSMKAGHWEDISDNAFLSHSQPARGQCLLTLPEREAMGEASLWTRNRSWFSS